MTMRDKIRGALFGLAIGDALGAPNEFKSSDEIKDQYGWIAEMMGGGLLGWKPGETTDDTAMTIAVAKGIIRNHGNPIFEIGEQFLELYQSNPKDIGITIQTVFSCYEGDWFMAANQAHFRLHGKTAGNGSLMRCLPVALAYRDRTRMEEVTRLQSKMTHYDELAADACLIYNRMAFRGLNESIDLKAVIRQEIRNTQYDVDLWNEPDVRPDGFVVNTLKWVNHLLYRYPSFEEVVQVAANLGNDSDTIGAIAGGLAGLFYGYGNLPNRYVNALIIKDTLLEVAGSIYSIRRHG